MDFRIPEDLLARPLEQGEVRVFVNNAWYIVGPGSLVRPEVPPSFDFSTMNALSSCSDQGPSNTASLNFIQFAGEGLMVNIQYDIFHRGWNDVKLSAKKAKGYPWRTILQCCVLFNMNYSPYGSSGFFYRKQDVLEQYMGSQTPADPNFKALIHKICRERRQQEPESAEEEEHLWRSLAHMDNFIKKGSLIKLMRWMSFFEVAAEWKGDMWATKLILLSDTDPESAGKAVPIPALLQKEEAADQPEKSKLDAKKELNELKKTTGVWKLAPKMVTERNVSTLDMILLVCKSTWKAHANRAKHVAQPDQVLQVNLASCSNLWWAFELEEMVKQSLWNKKEISHMYPKLGLENQQQLLEDHCDFFHQLLNTRATSLAAAYTLPPMRWNGVLDPNHEEAEAKREHLLAEWEHVLHLEGAALHSTSTDVLDRMYWRLATYNRVLCMAHQQDKLAGLSCIDGKARPLQLLVAKTLGDSRVIEVAHQKGPDLARASRHNTIPPIPVMFGTIQSGALELRETKHLVKVNAQELVYPSKNYRMCL